MTGPLRAEPSGHDIVRRQLETGELVTRWVAAEEIIRILAQRERDWPPLVAAKRIQQAEADARNGRLACAWFYVCEPRVDLAGPHNYRNDMQRALWLAEARGWKPASS